MKTIPKLVLISILLSASTIYAGENESSPVDEDADHSTIPYPSVAEALSDLRGRKDLTTYTQGGWTVFDETPKEDRIISWYFSPPTYVAYPAVAKRTTYRASDGSWLTQVEIKCESDKRACDKMQKDYEELTRRMTEDLAKKHKPGS